MPTARETDPPHPRIIAHDVNRAHLYAVTVSTIFPPV
jgi:hypothetical protein